MRIEDQINKLTEKEALLARQRKILEREEIHAKQDKLKPLVGMTFKQGNTYFKITNIPQIEWVGEEARFNPYRVPCLTLFDQLGQTFKRSEDTVFTNAVNAPDVKEYIRKEYQEITPEQFQEKLHQAIMEA